METGHKLEGFYGPLAAAQAGMAIIYAVPSVGIWFPPWVDDGGGNAALPDPVPVDVDQTDFMFAVATPIDDPPLPLPAGLKRARPDMVGRILGI